MFAIIDVETTGLNPSGERITEIAVYLHDGNKVTDEYQTLLNPEKRIPHQITGLTGISNRMVADQARFCEIAKAIVEMTEGRIIVGHNVSFDYRFLRAEFKRLFYDFKRKTLCTKQLSRKLIPGLHSYGLGAICKDLNILIEGRHRAGGDALATVKLFEHLRLLEDDLLKLSLKGLNSNLSRKIVDTLPEETGVYYFIDESGQIIYIGKSLNIRDRILSHQINRCHGACLGKEPAEEYNQRVDTAIEKYIFRENDFFVIDQGRRDDELAIVKVCNGSYQGFGYISKEASEEIDLLNENIRPYADNKDIQVIIKGYLRKYPEVKTIRF